MMHPTAGLATAVWSVVTVFVCSMSTAEGGSILEGKTLGRAPYCSGQVLEGSGLYRTFPVRSKLDCATHCHPGDGCESVVYDRDSKLCWLGDAKAHDNCSNMESAPSSRTFYQGAFPCGEGEVKAPNGLCVCAPGFTGDPCVRYFHDCHDIKQYGDWQGDGVYTVFPLAAPTAFEVYCRHISSTRTYIMDRRRNKVDFHRPWDDYRIGFGDFNSDFWIGLEKIYALTQDRLSEMRVNVKVQNNTSYLKLYREFRVTDEASGYRLTFNNSYPNWPNDCLLLLYNARFSTWDHDQDESPDVNCAMLRQGGFWFRGDDCSTCNPLGIISVPEDGMRAFTEDEAFWDDSLGNLSIAKVSMYLLPQSPHNW